MDENDAPSIQLNSESDFDSVYANNALFEPSVWDLKIIFGQLEQHSGKTKVDWHTAVTMPWMQAKILSYYLRLNLAFNELQSGQLKIPDRVLPSKPQPPSPESKDPTEKELYEVMKKIHEEMFG